MRKEFEDQKLRERGALERAGYEFIRLELLKPGFSRMSAVEIVRPIQSTDDTTGARKFIFDKTFGRVIFEENPSYGNPICDIIATEYNKKFLASHFDSGIFKIVDEKWRKEIGDVSKKVAKLAIKTKPFSSDGNNTGSETVKKDPEETLEVDAIPIEDDDPVEPKKPKKQRGAITIEE